MRLSQPAEAQIESLAVGPKIRMEGIVAQRGMGGTAKSPMEKDPGGTKAQWRGLLAEREAAILDDLGGRETLTTMALDTVRSYIEKSAIRGACAGTPCRPRCLR